MSDSLALFPLSRALVPQASLKLQLFEQRYLKLIRNCMASGKGFGIVGLESGEETQVKGAQVKADSGIATDPCKFYPYGCYVNILDWDQLENGLLGITLLGERRFVVRSSEQDEDGLWMAQVDWLEDYRRAEVSTDYQGIKELFESLAQYSGHTNTPDEDAAALGWAIANILPLGNEIFSLLLAEDDPIERLEIIATQIDQLSVR